MANGTYGTKRPAQITAADVDIFYYYRPSNSTEAADFSGFKQLSSNLLSEVTGEYSDAEGTPVLTLPGMYNLRLPLDVFGKKGIYTIYIKPKEIFRGFLTETAVLLQCRTFAESCLTQLR